MSNTKIYLNDGTEEFVPRTDESGTPYITFDEVLNSLNSDERYDDSLKLAKEIVDDFSSVRTDNRVCYLAIHVLDKLSDKLDDNDAVKMLVNSLNLFLKDIYI